MHGSALVLREPATNHVCIAARQTKYQPCSTTKFSFPPQQQLATILVKHLQNEKQTAANHDPNTWQQSEQAEQAERKQKSIQ